MQPAQFPTYQHRKTNKIERLFDGTLAPLKALRSLYSAKRIHLKKKQNFAERHILKALHHIEATNCTNRVKLCLRIRL
jgi:hypothetical protein